MNKDKELKTKEEPITIQAIEHAIIGDQDKAQAQHYKDAVAAFDPKELVKVITIKDEVSGKTGTYELDRGGTRDQKLAMVLADNGASDEKKLATMSLWLFEKGMNNASFMADLMVHRGTQTQELRKFQSTMRFDFTMFVGLFCNFLTDNARTMLGAISPNTEPMGLVSDAVKYLSKEVEKYQAFKNAQEKAKRKEEQVKFDSATMRETPPSLHEWAEIRYHQIGSPDATAQEEKLNIMFLELGVRYASEANNMRNEIQNQAEERERAMGKPFPGNR